MDTKVISTGIQYTSLPESYVRPESERPKLSEVQDCEDVPIIDLSCEDRASILRQIGNACQSFGFFQAINHGVPLELLDKMLANKILRLSVEEKLKLYSDVPTKTMRLSTSFNVKKETVHNWRDYLRLHCHPLDQYVPEWPSNPATFKEVLPQFGVGNPRMNDNARRLNILCREVLPQFGVGNPRMNDNARRLNILSREVLPQFGVGDPGMNDNARRRACGDDQRILIGSPTTMIFSTKWNEVFFGMLGFMLALIQTMYQNQENSPFQTHPTMMDISIATLCIYGFAAATATLAKSVASKEMEQQPRNYYRILNILGLGFDILGLISSLVCLSCLGFILIPKGPSWIVFVLGAIIFFALVVAGIFLFPRIFRPTNSGQGAAGSNMV